MSLWEVIMKKQKMNSSIILEAKEHSNKEGDLKVVLSSTNYNL